MAAFFAAMQLIFTVALPTGAFLLIRRRPHHTRRQLIAGAALGGGLGGAMIAAFVAAGGASMSDGLPFAVLGLISGSLVGLLGVVAFALGGWLNREP